MKGDLTRLRGGFPTVRLTARRVAAVVEAPGCDRRVLLDGAGVDTAKLAGLLTGTFDRQSPQAMARTVQFTQMLEANEHAQILALARMHLGLELREVRKRDMADAAGSAELASTRETLRARFTRHEIARILRGDEAACNLLINPVTPLRVGPRTAWLEQDVLAFAEAGHISVVMIKTFDYLDGEADPKKVGQTAREAAAHVLSLQELVEQLGYPSDRVGTKILLILPGALSFRPVGQVIDVAPKVDTLRRRLAALPDVEVLAEDIGIPVALPDVRNVKKAGGGAREQALEVVQRLPFRFGDGCPQCPMFRVCRDEAQQARDTSRLGSAVAATCGEVTSIDQAIALAQGTQQPATRSEAALADVLGRAAAAHARAEEAA
jgi:hypothetical protein